jgi:6-phosphofructokinase 1
MLKRGDRVALLTSGGDAPGMNAALRGAARVGAALGLEMRGVVDGYAGLLEGRFVPLDLQALDEASRRGGTVLGTARSKVFPTAEGQARARQHIANERLRGLLVIGGNGSLAGARSLLDVRTDDGPLVIGGVPASIDNDLACTSMSIGVDTALNTIVEAVDRLADTATAHRRAFFIEVMGRDCGYLAMTSSIASGADVVLIRETGRTEEQIVAQVVTAMERAFRDTQKRRVLVIKAEGVRVATDRLKSAVDEKIASSLPDVDTRVTVLGHVVRGGTPSAFDRLLGARLANAAIRAMIEGQSGMMAGWLGPGITSAASPHDPYVVLTPIEDVLRETARLMDGESPLAQWRRRTFQDIDPILTR